MIEHGVVERAFELARTGRCRTVDEIRKRLARESYVAVDAHLAGASIRRQLKALMRDAPECSMLPAEAIDHRHPGIEI